MHFSRPQEENLEIPERRTIAMKNLFKPAFFTTVLAVSVFFSVAAAFAAPFAYITNRDSKDVSIIDIATDTVVKTLSLGYACYGVAANLAGTWVYVAHFDSSKISVIETASNSLVTTISLGTGNPVGVAVNPSGTRLYATNSGTSTVSVVDLNTYTAIATVPVGLTPYGVAVTPSGDRVYVANNGTNTVSVIDTKTNTVISTVTVGSNPFGVAVNRSGTRVYVSNKISDNLSVIDTSSNTVITTIPVGSRPHGVALNPASTLLYVANRDGNNVSVIDTGTNTVTATIPVGNALQGITTNPEGTRVYVASFGSNTVAILDAETNTVIPGDIPVGTSPVALGQFINRGAIWEGTVSSSIKLTSPVPDSSGNIKFHSVTNPLTGTLSRYEEGGLPNQFTFISDDGTISFQIRSISYVETEVPKSRTDQSVFIGMGDFSISISGTTYQGIVYLDAKETLKKDGTGKIVSVSLNGKISGGIDLILTFTANMKATLTK
jgi:YVTN family beta-propeller protein